MDAGKFEIAPKPMPDVELAKIRMWAFEQTLRDQPCLRGTDFIAECAGPLVAWVLDGMTIEVREYVHGLEEPPQ